MKSIMGKKDQSQFEALESVKVMRENARRVNDASNGRLVFLEEVVNQSRTITNNVEEIQQRSKNNNNILEGAVQGMVQVVGSIDEVVSLVSGSREKAERMTTTLDRFENQFQKVTEISSAISGVSKQTNMLALNAMIEAKRAGKYGEGFTVVAQEVKALANTTGDAAHHIDKLMRDLLIGISEIVRECRSLSEDMVNANTTGRTSLQKIESVGITVKEAVAHGSETADSAAEQVGVFGELVDKLSELKVETEAAIVGSATNIELANEVINALEKS